MRSALDHLAGIVLRGVLVDEVLGKLGGVAVGLRGWMVCALETNEWDEALAVIALERAPGIHLNAQDIVIVDKGYVPN